MQVICSSSTYSEINNRLTDIATMVPRRPNTVKPLASWSKRKLKWVQSDSVWHLFS